MITLIGILGTSGIGKSTLANAMEEDVTTCTPNHIGLVYGLADKLKKTSRELFPLIKSYEYYQEHRKEKELIIFDYKMSPRDIYIHVGLCMRKINPNVWIDYLMTEIDSQVNDYVSIIADVRFENEVNVIKAKGGIIIKLERETRIEMNTADVFANFYEGADITYKNNRSIKDLKSFGKEIVSKYIIERS